MEKISEVLCLWAIIGYFVAPLLPKPMSRMEGIFQAIIGGPLVWIGVILMGVFKRRGPGGKSQASSR